MLATRLASKIFFLTFIGAFFFTFSLGAELSPRFQEGFGKFPLYFIENRGQVDSRVEYYIKGNDTTLFFTANGVTFLQMEYESSDATVHKASFGLQHDPPKAKAWALKLEFLGANPNVKPEGLELTPAIISYFKGPKDQWKTGLKTYASIIYRDLWPGIDLVYSGSMNRLKYTFFVKPGADPNQVQLAYRGASSLTISDGGQLQVSTPLATINDEEPYSYQEVDGKRLEIMSAYRLGADGSQIYGFRVGNYDKSKLLILDPAALVYGGFIGGSGGSGGNLGESIAVDGSGNAYITGETGATEATFPDGDGFGAVPGVDQTYNGKIYDAFVAKINAEGTALVYAGYIGGIRDDYGEGIAVDGFGNAYITGQTHSREWSFPDGDGFDAVPGPDQTYNGGFGDAFVAKINAAGTALLYVGYIGGRKKDSGGDIAVDGLGNAYITGYTESDERTFPDGDGFGGLPGPDQTFNGGFYDAFVAKVNAAGTALLYAGYIGGDKGDTTSAIAVDGLGNAYITGVTDSNQNTFPDGDGFNTVPGPDHTYNQGSDAFVVKVNAKGTALLYAGYIGGSLCDWGYGIAVDGSGNANVTGFTCSTETTFPDGNGFGAVPGPDQTFNGSTYDAFVAKVNAAGTALVYAGYIGGDGIDFGYHIAVDDFGNAYISGETQSDEFTFPDGDGFGAVPGPDQTFNGGSSDAFVAKVNAAGTALLYAGYIGGSEYDSGYGIAVDSSGNAYLTGFTQSTETTFPDGDGFGAVPGFDQTSNGFTDAYVVKISD